MGTDGQAFNRVKNLLGKLDRSIDEARDKRLGKVPTDGPAIGAPAQATPSQASRPLGPSTLIGQGSAPPPQPAPPAISGTPAPPETSKSGFGRAKPLIRPASSNQDSLRRWGT